MSFTKVTYVDGTTVIHADNLNDIQDELITIVNEIEGIVVNVSGSTPEIVGEANHRYMCGEVSTISITPPEEGTIEVLFRSGETATVLTIPETVKFPGTFDPSTLLAYTIYDICIMDGVYGAVIAWED